MSDKSEIEAIRARDAASADTWFKEPPLGACGRAFIDRRTLLAHVDALEARVARLEAGWEITTREAINPTHEAADAFWKYWRENGETHKHGYYESTWGAINAALAEVKP